MQYANFVRFPPNFVTRGHLKSRTFQHVKTSTANSWNTYSLFTKFTIIATHNPTIPDPIVAPPHAKKWRKIRKGLFITFLTLTLLFITILLFASPIAKYLIEKYDVKYIGRETTVDNVYLNPFTGFVRLNQLQIFEFESDSIFMEADFVEADFAILKLMVGDYQINHIKLQHPKIQMIQGNEKDNIDDLIQLFNPPELTDEDSSTLALSILNIDLYDGEFLYKETEIPVQYSFKNIDISSTGYRWDVDTISVAFSFESGIGSGSIQGYTNVNTVLSSYFLNIQVQQLDLKIIEQYLADLMNYGRFTAIFEADIQASGSFLNPEVLTTAGNIEIQNFHFGKDAQEDYAAFEKFRVVINELSPQNHIYNFDTLDLNKALVAYERYDYLDNLQNIFGQDGDNIAEASGKFNLVIEIAQYVKILAKNFFSSNYEVGSLSIRDGNLKFKDFSLNEKFEVELHPFNIIADSINRKNSRINVQMNSQIQPFGKGSISLSVNPKDSSDFDLVYRFSGIALSIFNPYTLYYTSFPFNKGSLDISGKWNVRNGEIKSDNHLTILDPRNSKKVKNKNNQWIPMPLILAFVKEKGNIIDYEIPISGDLKDPNFHLSDVILDILRNMIVKPLTTPYRFKVKNNETEIEKFHSLQIYPRQYEFTRNQDNYIHKISEFLKKDASNKIDIYPQYYSSKEKEALLLYEAKKKFYLLREKMDALQFIEKDSIRVDKMSVKDSLFVQYLERNTNNSLAFTIQEKCLAVFDQQKLNKLYDELNEVREKNILSLFIKHELMKQVTIHKADMIVPYNGFSFFKIVYSGDLPDKLEKAYNEMNDLNDEAPRNEFEEKRKETLKVQSKDKKK